MKREKVTEFYQLIMPNENAESFVEEIFQNFDNDNNGLLDFQVLSDKNLRDGGQFWFSGVSEVDRFCRKRFSEG